MLDDVKQRLQHAASLLQQGKLVELRRSVNSLKASHAGVGDVWALEGELCIRERQLSPALSAVNRALELDPHLPERYVQHARCHVLAGLHDQALSSAKVVLNNPPKRLDHLLVLAGVLVRCDALHEALEVYHRAIQLNAQSAEAHQGLASVYRFLGDVAAAESAANQAIALNPNDYESIALRSSLRKATPEHNHVAYLEKRLQGSVSNWRGAVQLGYALAKEREDLGDFASGFSVLKQAADAKRRHTRYDLDDDLAIFDRIRSAFRKNTLASLRDGGCKSAEPIFVLGMPRTGSTLVERIITSHSAVQNIGESSAFPLEMTRLATQANGDRPVPRLELPARCLTLPMQSLGQRYLDALDSARDGSMRFVDKLPQNSLNVGLIHAALPQAKLVHVTRDPMDACYAMYKYLFRNGYPWSYNLVELGRYYAAYYRLMQHWRSLVPAEALYEVAYEQVVTDVPGEARRLLEWLALPWEDACAQFQDNRRASTTGSATQVRQPVYRSSVGRWRCYEKQLQPLRETLQAAGVPV